MIQACRRRGVARARWAAARKTMGPQTIGTQNHQGLHAHTNKGKAGGKGIGEGKTGAYQNQTRASSSSEMPGPHSSQPWQQSQGSWQRGGQWGSQDR